MDVYYFLVFTQLVSNIFGAKILYLGFPFYSHVQNLATIAGAMVDKGHEAWIAAPPSLKVKLNLEARQIKTLPFLNPRLLEERIHHLLNDEESSPIKHYWRTGRFATYYEPTKHVVHTMLTDKLFLSSIEQQHFDLVILDNTVLAHMLCIIPYKYNIPFIFFGINYDPFVARIPFSPSFVPYIASAYTDRLSFTDRVQNTLFFAYFVLYAPFCYSNAVSVYAPEKPFVELVDIQRKAKLTLIQWNYLLNYPSPVMPHVVQIGQIFKQELKKLPSEYEDFLSGSKHGVVLVSFGSIAPTATNPLSNKLLSAFKNTKYNYIIKGTYASSTKQMLVANWIPQQMILKHHKTKLFVTHCGANGLGEAIANGIPMLGFPLFAEQPGNSLKMATRGYGISMDLFTALEADIYRNINELIVNPKYKNSVKRASEIQKSRPSNGTKDAVFWIEHVLEFGSDYMTSSSVDMPWYQYVMLDVLVFLFFCTICVILVIYICFCKIYRVVKHSKLKLY